MGIIELKNVNLILNQKPILNNLTIDFWPGHVHAVVGPNGAGKSTLAATIMGLSGYIDIQGDILFNGESIKNLSVDERAKKGITLAWQEPARFEGITVHDFIYAASKDKNIKSIKQVLIQVGLSPEEYLYRAVDRTVSGGERKKIELASILAMKPKVALLDEPDSGIDIESIEKIFEAVKLLREEGTTVILITHSLAVLRQAEHAFLLCHGELIDKGPTENIVPYFQGKCIPCDHKNEPDLNKGRGGVSE